jgi:hypothetical protein
MHDTASDNGEVRDSQADEASGDLAPRADDAEAVLGGSTPNPAPPVPIPYPNLSGR